VPLRLRITVTAASTCRPLKGAAVDIWHADGLGENSDESSQGTLGQTWLRGVQLTDTYGLARFTTIYPGFYQARAPPIHVKVHSVLRVSGSVAAGLRGAITPAVDA
jgi:protocatechuate 3,4-dioxygenase beta subunit